MVLKQFIRGSNRSLMIILFLMVVVNVLMNFVFMLIVFLHLLLCLQANAKILPRGKVPVLCAIIEGVKVHSADASVTLRDPSG